MIESRYVGQILEIPLPAESGHDGYSVECIYRYAKSRGKFALSMRLRKRGFEETFKIDTQEIDTQFISGDTRTVRDNICRIVEQASLSGFFDPYVARFQYTYDCIERGNELYESERLNAL